MEILPFINFILWSTGLSTIALVVMAVADWRIERRSQEIAAATRVAAPLRSKAAVPTPAPATAQPVLLKAA